LIKRQDEKALAELYNRYYLPLCKKAFQRIPFLHKVEEIVQDVFITVWSKSETLDADGNIRAYLYAILRNKVLHELRTERSRSYYMAELKVRITESSEDYSFEEMDTREREMNIHEMIRGLPPQCQKVFSLSRFENLSYKEIAHQLNLSVNTVEKHVSKALHILRGKVKEQYKL